MLICSFTAILTELAKDGQIGDNFIVCPDKNSKLPILLSHPEDCGKFYICDKGIAHLKVCQPGLHFNPVIKACDYPKNVGCGKGI